MTVNESEKKKYRTSGVKLERIQKYLYFYRQLMHALLGCGPIVRMVYAWITRIEEIQVWKMVLRGGGGVRACMLTKNDVQFSTHYSRTSTFFGIRASVSPWYTSPKSTMTTATSPTKICDPFVVYHSLSINWCWCELSPNLSIHTHTRTHAQICYMHARAPIHTHRHTTWHLAHVSHNNNQFNVTLIIKKSKAIEIFFFHIEIIFKWLIWTVFDEFLYFGRDRNKLNDAIERRSNDEKLFAVGKRICTLSMRGICSLSLAL